MHLNDPDNIEPPHLRPVKTGLLPQSTGQQVCTLLPWQFHSFSVPEATGVVHRLVFHDLPKLLSSLDRLDRVWNVFNVLSGSAYGQTWVFLGHNKPSQLMKKTHIVWIQVRFREPRVEHADYYFLVLELNREILEEAIDSCLRGTVRVVAARTVVSDRSYP
jgi:hypothetical protein